MANVPRSPLYVGKREVSPLHQIGFTNVVCNLLLTTLAVVAVSLLPQGAGHSASLQTQFRPGLFPNADTSRGTPKTLRAELRDPFHVLQENQPRLAQHRDFERINANTSLGTAKTLRDDQIPPRFVAPHFAPNATWLKSWLPADTTKGTPKTLITELVEPAGTVAPFIVPLATRIASWLPADTSLGVAKTLRPELVKPVFVAPQFAPSAKPSWQPADTSQGQNPDVRVPPVVTSPPFLTPTLSPQLRWWQPADSSAGTAEVLRPEATLPFRVLQQPVLALVRPVTDTSVGTAATLLTVIPPPVPPVSTGGGDFAMGGGKRNLPCLEELDVFKKLECRRPGQTIVEALRELDTPAAIEEVQEVLREAKQAVADLSSERRHRAEIRGLQAEIASLQKQLKVQHKEVVQKQQDEDDDDDDLLLIGML